MSVRPLSPVRRVADSETQWQRFQRCLCKVPSIGLTLDVSRVRFDDDFIARMEPAMRRAFDAMEALERGTIANPDENRMVGHYWLRAPDLAPNANIAEQIRNTLNDVKSF